MSDVPNFKKGVGRLATDRYDFQSHLDGTDFRQAAGTVDLVPTILIGSTVISDVQTAIEALSGSIIVPSVPDATTTSKGIIQLGGDLFGTGTTALNPIVSGLQGRPITTTLPSNLDVLTWDASIPAWKPSAVPGSINIAGDLAGVGSTLGVPKVGGLQGFSVSNNTPTSGQALVWNSGTSKWTPTGIPASPTGTGFATLTSGTYDAAATNTIRYTGPGGKFQTDANIQYNNGGIFGDLAWAPTSTNKTLTLPNATDTLVGQATTDSLTNKTINASSNTLTDTSATLGDILAIVSGTKFTRLAKGVNGSFLGVSGGVLGYFTPSGSTPSGTGFATVTGGTYDSAATNTIRFTGPGGKFQTDNNIQFKTSGNLGDLAWGALSTTRTLSLPDATDTLIGKATTDILTNKTFDVVGTGNALISTSQATGDLLKNNGSAFVRFARGTGLQVLRTNAGATDLEWATVTLPATQVRIDQSGAGQLNNITSVDGSSNQAAIIRFTGDGASTDILLSGITAPAAPTSSSTIVRLTLMATSSSKLILSNLDGNSTSTNQLKFFGAANSQFIVGTDGYSAEVVWDNAASGSGGQKWRLVTDSKTQA